MICVGRSDFWIYEFNNIHPDLNLCLFILQHFALMPLTVYTTSNSWPHHFCFNIFWLCTRMLLRVYKTLGVEQGWEAVCSVFIHSVVICLYFHSIFCIKIFKKCKLITPSKKRCFRIRCYSEILKEQETKMKASSDHRIPTLKLKYVTLNTTTTTTSFFKTSYPAFNINVCKLFTVPS